MRELNCARVPGVHSADTVALFSGRSKPEDYTPWPYVVCGKHSRLGPELFPHLTQDPEPVQ